MQPSSPALRVIRLPNHRVPGDNRSVPSTGQISRAPNRDTPFQPGTMAVVTLGSPREKFWGAVLSLTAEGISLCGVELASFEDLVSMIKEGEPLSPTVVFFPMHRVERMEMDLPDGSIPSLSQRFAAKTNFDAATVLSRHLADHIPAHEERE